MMGGNLVLAVIALAVVGLAGAPIRNVSTLGRRLWELGGGGTTAREAALKVDTHVVQVQEAQAWLTGAWMVCITLSVSSTGEGTEGTYRVHGRWVDG